MVRKHTARNMLRIFSILYALSAVFLSIGGAIVLANLAPELSEELVKTSRIIPIGRLSVDNIIGLCLFLSAAINCVAAWALLRASANTNNSYLAYIVLTLSFCTSIANLSYSNYTMNTPGICLVIKAWIDLFMFATLIILRKSKEKKLTIG